MQIRVYDTKQALGQAAAADAARAIEAAIAARGRARIVAATGASQFEFLQHLVAAPGIDWDSVELFHLDEYVGIADDHPASFRRYLRERLIAPTGMRRVHLLDADGDAERTRVASGVLIAEHPVDIAFVGIGENAHLAFNDPPADFETEDPYLLVSLDEACRRQQVGEGWFPDVESVPTRAISMSCRQILKSRRLLAIVPDARKAAAVKAAVEGPVDPRAPASILQTHRDVTLFLDRESSATLAQPPAVTTTA